MQSFSAPMYAMMISIIVLMIIIITSLGLFYIKKKNAILVFLIGTFGYLIPQICIRYPVVSILQTSVFSSLNIILVILLLSFSTAFSETIGRYLVIKIGLKNEQNNLSGILIGFGHGSCEAFFLLVVTYLNNLFILYLSQLGAESTQINIVLSAIGNIPLRIFYFTLLERILYIIIQTGLSTFMMNRMITHKKATFISVVAIHFVIDFSITVCSTYGVDIIVINGIIGVVALLSIWYIGKLYRLPQTKKKENAHIR